MLLLLLTDFTILTAAIKTMIRNFNHRSGDWASIKVLGEKVKFRAKVEPYHTTWLVGKSIH